MSLPAVNTPSEPVISTAPIAPSLPLRLSAAVIESYMAPVSAFFFVGPRHRDDGDAVLARDGDVLDGHVRRPRFLEGLVARGLRAIHILHAVEPREIGDMQDLAREARHVGVGSERAPARVRHRAGSRFASPPNPAARARSVRTRPGESARSRDAVGREVLRHHPRQTGGRRHGEVVEGIAQIGAFGVEGGDHDQARAGRDHEGRERLGGDEIGVERGLEQMAEPRRRPAPEGSAVGGTVGVALAVEAVIAAEDIEDGEVELRRDAPHIGHQLVDLARLRVVAAKERARRRRAR